MKCEVAGSLLHRPEVLFLDEPTIGLDVTMQRRIRSFIAEYNARTGATTLLTSHYMADVEALCRRVIVIHHGRLLYDGDLSGLISRFSPHKTIVLDLEQGSDPIGERIDRLVGTREWIVGHDDGRLTLRVPRSETATVTTRLLAELPVLDVVVEEPPIDEVIDLVFAARPEDAPDGTPAGAAAAVPEETGVR
jgi:ABC-2 type transport system ATP-binding protein